MDNCKQNPQGGGKHYWDLPEGTPQSEMKLAADWTVDPIPHSLYVWLPVKCKYCSETYNGLFRMVLATPEDWSGDHSDDVIASNNADYIPPDTLPELPDIAKPDYKPPPLHAPKPPDKKSEQPPNLSKPPEIKLPPTTLDLFVSFQTLKEKKP